MRKWTLTTEVPDHVPSTVEVGEATISDDGTLHIRIFSGLLTLRPITGKPQLETEIDLPQFMSEICRAHAVKTLKFLGVSFFVNRWKGTGLPNNREYRRTCLDLAVKQGLIEIYDAPTREPGIYDQAIRILEIP